MLFGRRLTSTWLANGGLSKMSGSSAAQTAGATQQPKCLSPLPLVSVSRQYSAESNRPKDPSESITSHQANFPVTKVLFDGDCKLCTKEIGVLKKFSKNKPVDFIDITDMHYNPKDHQGVTYEMAMKEMHVIGPDNKVYTQGDAVRQMYTASGFGWLSSLTRLPGVRQVADHLYLKFAHYRLAKALENCDSGTCSIKLHELKRKLENKTS